MGELPAEEREAVYEALAALVDSSIDPSVAEHCEVLFTEAEVERRIARLRASTEPTLQAPGYPKEET